MRRCHEPSPQGNYYKMVIYNIKLNEELILLTCGDEQLEEKCDDIKRYSNTCAHNISILLKAPPTWDNDSVPEKKQDQNIQNSSMAG